MQSGHAHIFPQSTSLCTTNTLCEDTPGEGDVHSTFQGPKCTYQILSRRSHDADLSIYTLRHGGEDFEAQVFTKCNLPAKLYKSRKKRIRRLRRSANFIEEFESDEGRIIVMSIPADGIERRGEGKQAAANEEAQHDLSVSNYPPLCLPQGGKTKSQTADGWSGSVPVSFAAAASSSRQPSGNTDTFGGHETSNGRWKVL